MLDGFYKEFDGIYRLRVPFEGIYTSVFLVVAEQGIVLVDCATTDFDVDTVILPALQSLGYGIADVAALVLTHKHGDHAGGLTRILRYAPQIEVVTEVRPLWNTLSTYPMGGHTEDSIGLLDGRTGTLLSGDGLQGAGVDKYRCSLKNPEAYRATLRRIQKDERIEHILFSHAYEPWNEDKVMGRKRVCDCLAQCEKYI